MGTKNAGSGDERRPTSSEEEPGAPTGLRGANLSRSGTQTTTRELSPEEVQEIAARGRKKREAASVPPRESTEEKQRREHEEALQRVRAHQRQSAQTRAMRPVNLPSPSSAPPSARPALPTPRPFTRRDPAPAPMNDDPARGEHHTTRPPPRSRGIRDGNTRPVSHSTEVPAAQDPVARVAELERALAAAEALLLSGEPEAALAVLRDHRPR